MPQILLPYVYFLATVQRYEFFFNYANFNAIIFALI